MTELADHDSAISPAVDLGNIQRRGKDSRLLIAHSVARAMSLAMIQWIDGKWNAISTKFLLGSRA